MESDTEESEAVTHVVGKRHVRSESRADAGATDAEDDTDAADAEGAE